MHPNGEKYVAASEVFRKIWLSYTDLVDFISLDEGFLDVTGSAYHFGGADVIGHQIKERTKTETGLTCSVGVGYSMMSAKLASEEMKPDGFFKIPDAKFLTDLIIDRNVRIIYGVGPKTAEALHNRGIDTVRQMLENKQRVLEVLGNHGQHYIDLAEGIDDRKITPYNEGEAKSVSREWTFQHDIKDFDYLKDALRLLAKELSLNIRFDGTYARTVMLKVKYSNMKLITRSKSGATVNQAKDIYDIAASMLDTIDKRPIRLIGIGLSGFEESEYQQITLDDISTKKDIVKNEKLDRTLLDLQRKYGGNVIKSGNEIIAERRIKNDEPVDN